MNHGLTGNILMVSNYPSDTGYAWWLMEHFWATLAERCLDQGGKAYLAYPEIRTLSNTIKDAPIEPVELCIPWKSREQVNHVMNFLREKEISLIYFTDQPYFNPRYAMMRRAGVHRIIIHDHTPGDRPPVLGLKGMLKAAKNQLPWFTADSVFCVSELMRQRNMENTRIPARKCMVVQNGISPVNCTGDRGAIVRDSLGIKPDCFLVLTTGRAHPVKRFDFIIDCADALRCEAPQQEVVFLLAGDGVALPDLHEKVRILKLENMVHLLGFRSDINDLLCASDLALHAAVGEGFSLSIVEYMSASLPVLVPDIPSVKQAISHNKTGLLYPENESGTVASHIHQLLLDTERRLAMGRAAKAAADNNYSLEICTKQFISAIEQSTS